MDKLLSDYAKTEISNKVMDILKAYHISNWHSEPYHQNQNPAEWRYRTIKSWTNTVMTRSGTPANYWLLSFIYVCYLLNHISCAVLDSKIPLFALTGIAPDISFILSDHFSNQICVHNPMATQCNQSQYLTLLKQICGHNPSPSRVSQANPFNSLTSQYPPDHGEHGLKKSATEIGKQDFPVKWFKFIYPSSNPMMTETSTLSPVHVAYSPIAFMNHQPPSWIPLSMFYYQRTTSHHLFPPSVTSSLPCFTLVLISSIPPKNLNMIFQV